MGQASNMAHMMKPWLISKKQAKTVGAVGGGLRVWTHLADWALAYAQNMRALVEGVGISQVYLGTDTNQLVHRARPVSIGSD
jgi:membrane dipeptidase